MSVPKGRQQLPPQIKKIELESKTRGKQNIRYEVIVDAGLNPSTGRRVQIRKRYHTEAEARVELSKILASVANGTYVHDRKTTVAEAIDEWLDGKHGLKPSTAHGYRVTLSPVVEALGDRSVQSLVRADLDKLIITLRAGGMPTKRGNPRKKWKARTVNYMLTLMSAMLTDQVKQGTLVRDVAGLIDRLPADQREMKTWTEDEVEQFLEHIKGDLYSLGLFLALCGLRRGEISGLQWDSVDLDNELVTIDLNRIEFGGVIHQGAPKSRRSTRTLPMPVDMVDEFKAARQRQRVAKMKLGAAWVDSGYVIVDEEGRPPAPSVLSYWWGRSLKSAGVPKIRFHDGRHTTATLMHLRNVPIAVIAEWLGHASSAFTQATYTHSQASALKSAASSLPVVTNRDKKAGGNG